MVYIGIKLKALKIAESVKVPPQAACSATGWLLPSVSKGERKSNRKI